MNKQYIIIEGKVTIVDEQGKGVKTDLSQNLEEILIKENEIEMLNSHLLNIENEIEARSACIQASKIILGAGLGIVTLISLFDSCSNLNEIVSFFNLIKTFQNIPNLIVTAIMLSVGFMQIHPWKKELESARIQQVYLEKELTNKKSELDILRKNSINLESKTNSVNEVKDKEALAKLNLYFAKLEEYSIKNQARKEKGKYGVDEQIKRAIKDEYTRTINLKKGKK